MTPRHRSLRRARLAGRTAAVHHDRSLSDACGHMFLLARSLHTAGVEPSERKRRLLAGLCRIADADRALCVVTRTDLTSGRQQILSADAVMVTMAPADPSSPPGDATHIVSIEPNVPSDGQAPASSGPAMDDFCWIDGLKLAAGITLSRSAGRARFDDSVRAVVAAIHQQCSWVYNHDRRLADLIEAGTAEADVRLLQSLLGTDGDTRLSRAERARFPAILARLGVTSRRELLERWAGDDRDHSTQ